MFGVSVHEKGTYLRDAVFAANDGIITTFAVVAGAAGAALSSSIVLILGFANLFADGFSMASGNYLGIKSQIEFEESNKEGNGTEGPPLKHGIITFVAFNIAGFLPLAPFVFNMENAFQISTILVGLSLFGVGSLRSLYTKKNPFKTGLETFLVGGLAAFVAFLVGFIIKKYTG